jgi:hypothetical protein
MSNSVQVNYTFGNALNDQVLCGNNGPPPVSDRIFAGL